jgi:hypothetical protein
MPGTAAAIHSRKSIELTEQFRGSGQYNQWLPSGIKKGQPGLAALFIKSN